MEYGASTAVPAQPVTEQQPDSGISAGGVFTLVVAVGIAVAVKWTGRRNRTVPQTGPKQDTKGSGSAPEALPVVGMEQLRGNSPAPVLEKAAEKGASLMDGPRAKLLAHKLGIPQALAQKLQKESWSAMCRDRNLAGLERGEMEATPYGVAVHVEFRGRLDFAVVQRGVDQLETGLDVLSGTIRLRKGVTAGRGIVDVRLRDPLADGVPWEAPAVPVRLAHPLKLAVTAFGDTVELDLKQRIGVFGTSGSGKSCAQRLIGAHVAAAIDAELDVWDFKHGVEAQHYAGKAHQVTSVGDAVSRVDWLLDTEFPRRAAKMKERGVSEWVETPWDPALVIVVDEGNALVRGFGEWREEAEEEGGKAGAKGAPLKRLFTAVEQGRALGVYWVWATQFPKAASLPTEIRSQLNATVCMKLRTDGEARVVFGDDDVSAGWAPQDLYGPGWLLVQDDTHTEPVDAKAVWLSVDSFRALSGTAGSGQDTDRAEDRTVLPIRTAGQSLSADCPVPSPVLSAVPDRTASTVSLDIWTVLLLSSDSLSLSELADRTGRAKSSVHGALAKMLEKDEVVRDGDDYRLRVADTDCGGDGS
jgi:hypothetical protein